MKGRIEKNTFNKDLKPHEVLNDPCTQILEGINIKKIIDHNSAS